MRTWCSVFQCSSVQFHCLLNIFKFSLTIFPVLTSTRRQTAQSQRSYAIAYASAWNSVYLGYRSHTHTHTAKLAIKIVLTRSLCIIITINALTLLHCRSTLINCRVDYSAVSHWIHNLVSVCVSICVWASTCKLDSWFNGASCKQANQLTKTLVFSEFSPIEYSSVYVDVVEHTFAQL